MNIELQNTLAELLAEAGHAHHRAFMATDGVDPEWPLWYADYLVEPLAQKLGLHLYKSQLVYCLMNAELEHQARSPECAWSEFYAHELLDHYMQSEDPAQDKLVLYHYLGCPFCSIASAAIDQLGIDVELRDILKDPQYRDELVKARGRATVPVLRITSSSGEDRWMPESRDIVHYLETTFA